MASDKQEDNPQTPGEPAIDLASAIDRLDNLIESLRFPPREDTLPAKAARQADVHQLAGELQARVPRGAEDEMVAGVELVAPVGEGEYGYVWRGMHDGRECAVKIHRWERLAVYGSLHAFRKGLRAMNILSTGADRPVSIPTILSVHAGSIAFSMPYYAGGNLTKVRTVGWRAEKKLQIFRAVCQAVHFAHGRGVLHRDIRPQNIVLDNDDQPYLVDFDIAEILGEETTRTTNASGNARWASPEQQRGLPTQKKPTTDVYSLGILLLYLFLEREPTDEDLQCVASDEPRTWGATVLQCTARRPEDRPQSVSEVLQLLGAGGVGIAAAYEPAALARARETWAEAGVAAKAKNYQAAVALGNQARGLLPLGEESLHGEWKAGTEFWQGLAGDLPSLQRAAVGKLFKLHPVLIGILGLAALGLAVGAVVGIAWLQEKGKSLASLPSPVPGRTQTETIQPTPNKIAVEPTEGIEGDAAAGPAEKVPVTTDPVGSEIPRDVPPGERIALLDRELLGGRNVWGEDYSGTIRYGWNPATAEPLLDGVILNGADLAAADLTHASLKRAELRSANFRLAKFSGADLTNADLRPLKQSELAAFGLVETSAAFNFYRADFGPSRIRSATLVDADLRGGRFLEASFADANLTGALFDGASVRYADFRGSNLVLEQVCTMYGWEEAKLPGDIWEGKKRVKPGALRQLAKTECLK